MLERPHRDPTFADWHDDGQPHVLHRDYETRSPLNLSKVGANRYAAHPSTSILVVGYTVDDEPVQQWFPGNPVPPVWFEAATNPRWIVAAHNDNFESAIEHYILSPRYGFPEIPLE